MFTMIKSTSHAQNRVLHFASTSSGCPSGCPPGRLSGTAVMKVTDTPCYYNSMNSLQCTAVAVDKYFGWKGFAMDNPGMQLGEAALNDLFKDAGIVKIVTAVNVASISILELLEYDVT